MRRSVSFSPMLGLLRGAPAPLALGSGSAFPPRPTLPLPTSTPQRYRSIKTYKVRMPLPLMPELTRTRRGDVRPIYVRNLTPDVNAETLAAAFAEYGEIRHVNVSAARQPGINRGFGYVEFVCESSTIKALEEAQGKEINGQSVMLEPRVARKIYDPVEVKARRDAIVAYQAQHAAQPKPTTPSCTLYIKLLSARVTEEEIRAACSQFGTVEEIKTRCFDDREIPRQSAKVLFATLDEATAARESLNFSHAEDEPEPIVEFFGTPKSELKGGMPDGASWRRGKRRREERAKRGRSHVRRSEVMQQSSSSKDLRTSWRE